MSILQNPASDWVLIGPQTEITAPPAKQATRNINKEQNETSERDFVKH